jgi:hypothetical protein
MKWIYLLCLVLGAIAGSIYMIIESSTYYDSLYRGILVGFMGLYTAVFCEFIQHVFILVKVKNSVANWFFRIITLIVFSLTVIAAGHNVAKPLIESINAFEWTQLKVQLLTAAIDNNKKDLEQLDKSQKTNRAIAIIERRKATGKLLTVFDEKPKKNGSTFEIWFLFLLKVIIQIATLSFSWLLGYIWRTKTILADRPAPLTDRPVRRYWNVINSDWMDFIGVIELKNGFFQAILPDATRNYKSFPGAIQPFKTTKFKLSTIPVEIS